MAAGAGLRPAAPAPPAIILIRAGEDFPELVVEAPATESAAGGGFFMLDDQDMRWRPYGAGRQ